MENASDFRVVFVTTGSYDSARNIARNLVSENLAACCSIVQNMLSVYEWKDNIEEESEFLLIIKTSASKLDNLEAKVRELHTYDVPEIISLAMDQGHKPYLDWMGKVIGIK